MSPARRYGALQILALGAILGLAGIALVGYAVAHVFGTFAGAFEANADAAAATSGPFGFGTQVLAGAVLCLIGGAAISAAIVRLVRERRGG